MTEHLKYITIRKPDDWHVHLRDGEVLNAVLPYTSKVYNRALIMPNLIPPITTVKAAISYRQRILNAIPFNHTFTPLMTCYLTDSLNLNEIKHGFTEGIFIAAKLYPINSTTNTSKYGIANIDNIMPALELMEKLGMPLSVHSEISCNKIDIFDREAYFIDSIIEPLRQRLPELKIVLEHITTKEAVEYVQDNKYLAATVTPQHLMFNRNHMLVNGIRPHLYCMPILKHSIHQNALQTLVTSGFNRVFLGSDSAPHFRDKKECNRGYPGCFSAPTALSIYATIFEKMNSFKHFESFCSLNGPHFYNLPINDEKILLVRKKHRIPKFITISNNMIIPLFANQYINWVIQSKEY